MSEEAEYLLSHIFRLRSAAAFSSCHMKHFTDSRTRAYIISQYTLRYRYVTGSWLRPDTP
ncbi:hypothetical protein AVB69_004725 [Salmonella enterica subsp. enterica]|nr:hypothetical protein [Salmonella enterica subsp. enterica]